jgi:hypothetical protein
MIHIDWFNHPFRKTDFSLLVRPNVNLLRGDEIIVLSDKQFEIYLRIKNKNGLETFLI